MLELLENKERTKILMLSYLFTSEKESMRGVDFAEAMPKFYTYQEESVKTKNTYFSLMKEIDKEVKNHSLQDKIPVELRGTELFVNHQKPKNMVYLTSIYLKKSVKYYILFKGMLMEKITYKTFCDFIYDKNFYFGEDRNCLIYEENAIRQKIYQLNREFAAFDFQVSTSFLLEGNEKNIRMYLYELMVYHMMPITAEDDFSEQGTKRYRDYCVSQTRELFKELKPYFKQLTQLNERAFSMFFGVCLFRINRGHTVDQEDLIAFNHQKNYSTFKKQIFDLLTSFYVKQGIEEKVAKEEAQFCMIFMYTNNFEFIDKDRTLISLESKRKMEEEFQEVVSSFEQIFHQPMEEELKMSIKEDTLKILSQILYFPTFGAQKISMTTCFLEENPLPAEWAYLVVDGLVKKYFPTLDEPCQNFMKKVHFNDIFYLFAYHLYEKNEIESQTIHRYLKQINICVQMVGYIAKAEYLKKFLKKSGYFRINFQREADEKTHIFISNVQPIQVFQGCQYYLWDQNISEEMLNLMKEKIQKLQIRQTNIRNKEMNFMF